MDSEAPGQGQSQSQSQSHHLGRRRATQGAAAVAALIVIVAAFQVIQHERRAGGRPWWSETGASGCGSPVMARVHGHRLYLGSCAGLLTIPAKRITLRIGQQVDIHMTQEYAGKSTTKLVPVYPLPRTSDRSVLMPTWTSVDQADASYQAVHQGKAVLASWAQCLSDNGRHEKTGRCPVLMVTVVP